MDKKDEIIAIVFGDKKLFYKASLISERDIAQQNASELEEIPDGQVKEFYADLCMEKTYKNGRLRHSIALTGRTEKTFGQLILSKAKQNAPHLAEGKTFLRNIHQRIFFIDGKQAALQELNDFGEVISTQGEPFTGEAKEYYPNGSIKREAFFKNGLPEGVVKTFDKEGRIIAMEEYKNGLREGKAKRVNYPNNIPLREELTFKNGMLNGERKVYSNKDQLLLSEEYKNGKRHGRIKMFSTSGAIEVQSDYKNGKLDGKRLFYYSNGKVMHEEYFSDGLLQGKRKSFSNNGTMILSENYKDNRLHGERISFYEDGKEKSKEFYENGKLIRKEGL